MKESNIKLLKSFQNRLAETGIEVELGENMYDEENDRYVDIVVFTKNGKYISILTPETDPDGYRLGYKFYIKMVTASVKGALK